MHIMDLILDFMQYYIDKNYIIGVNIITNVVGKDESVENYDNLSMDRFVPLSKMTHDAIHFVYRYYRKDKHILERIREVLERMLEYEYTI